MILRNEAFFFQAEEGIRDDCDWSSDVCSSDLVEKVEREDENEGVDGDAGSVVLAQFDDVRHREDIDKDKEKIEEEWVTRLSEPHEEREEEEGIERRLYKILRCLIALFQEPAIEDKPFIRLIEVAVRRKAEKDIHTVRELRQEVLRICGYNRECIFLILFRRLDVDPVIEIPILLTPRFVEIIKGRDPLTRFEVVVGIVGVWVLKAREFCERGDRTCCYERIDLFVGHEVGHREELHPLPC